MGREKKPEEYERILANPPNLIMSDFLEGRVDESWSEEVSPWETTEFRCEIAFGTFTLRGDLRNFGFKKDRFFLEIRATAPDAIQVLSDHYVSEVSCYSLDGTNIWQKDFDQDANISVRLDEDNKALLFMNLLNEEDI